ncbi:MAG: hypothetical protein ACREMY_30100, partial [bacterium]
PLYCPWQSSPARHPWRYEELVHPGSTCPNHRWLSMKAQGLLNRRANRPLAIKAGDNWTLGGRFLCYLPFLWLLLGCSDSTEGWEVPAKPPLSKVSYDGRILAVYPAAGVDWKSLIDLRVFETLRPDVTFDQARARLGAPSLTGKNALGPYIGYERPWGNLEVGYETQSSGADSYETWSLHAYPTHSTAKDFLHPAILKYLIPQKERTEVFLTKNGETVLQIVLLRGLRVRSINWIKD